MRYLNKLPAIPVIFLMALLFFSFVLILSCSGILGLFVFSVSIFYVIYFGFINKRSEITIYFFIFLTLFFPQGKSYDSAFFSFEVWNITPFLFFQVVGAFPIAIQLLMKKEYAKLQNGLRPLVYLLVFAAFGYLLFEVVLLVVNLFVEKEMIVHSFASYIEFFCSIIFLYGCMVFIKTKKQVHVILILLLIASVEMGLEAYLYGILALPLPRAENVINASFENKFVSLIYGDYVKLTYCQYAGVAIAMYYFIIKKKIYYLLFIPLQVLPLVLTFQRTPLISIVIIIVFFYLVINKKIFAKIFICSIIGLCIYFFQDIILFIFSLGLVEPEQFKVNYFAINQALGSGVDRIGLALRGIEIFIYNFPFGVGANYDRFTDFMISKTVPTYFKEFLHQNIPNATFYYSEVTLGGVRTDTHNFIVFFLVQFGFLGLLIMIQISLIIARASILLKKFSHNKMNEVDGYYLLLLALSFIFGSLFSFFFQSAVPYSILFFFIFLLKFSSEGTAEKKTFDQPETKNISK